MSSARPTPSSPSTTRFSGRHPLGPSFACGPSSCSGAGSSRSMILSSASRRPTASLSAAGSSRSRSKPTRRNLGTMIEWRRDARRDDRPALASALPTITPRPCASLADRRRPSLRRRKAALPRTAWRGSDPGRSIRRKRLTRSPCYGEKALAENRWLYVTSDGCHPNRVGANIVADALGGRGRRKPSPRANSAASARNRPATPGASAATDRRPGTRCRPLRTSCR